jgi:hypothetical protein
MVVATGSMDLGVSVSPESACPPGPPAAKASTMLRKPSLSCGYPVSKRMLRVEEETLVERLAEVVVTKRGVESWLNM